LQRAHLIGRQRLAAIAAIGLERAQLRRALIFGGLRPRDAGPVQPGFELADALADPVQLAADPFLGTLLKALDRAAQFSNRRGGC